MTDAELVAELLERCRDDHRRWINGDASGYVLPADASLMGAFGGSTTGGPTTAERQKAFNQRTWLSGEGDVTLVAGGRSGDVVWLVMIEQAKVMFPGAAEPARWDLRVTELFRLVDSAWERFHRHADPLVDIHALDEVVTLLPAD
jgi:hypothetical protein